MAGIYLHIPFCKKACHYCNFHFSVSKDGHSAMIAMMAREAQLRKSTLHEEVETIYFGGGTPSLLNIADLNLLLHTLHAHYNISHQAEITLEANPDDISQSRLEAWKQLGINRLSIGIQSFFASDLRWMNRAHTAEQAIDCIREAKAAGFNNMSIDLIYGTPGLSHANWIQNIETAVALGIPHLSCYALTVEPATALDSMIRNGKKAAIDTSILAEQFELLAAHLTKAGYEHYEISNFAQPGCRSKHNSSYWQGKPYLGIGPSAHSFDGQSRQWNVANNSLYLQALQQAMIPSEKEVLTPNQQLNEYIMTSLRTMEGCSLKYIEAKWGAAMVAKLQQLAQKHCEQGTLQLADNQLILTAKGKFLADGIAADLFQL